LNTIVISLLLVFMSFSLPLRWNNMFEFAILTYSTSTCWCKETTVIVWKIEVFLWRSHNSRRRWWRRCSISIMNKFTICTTATSWRSIEITASFNWSSRISTWSKIWSTNMFESTLISIFASRCTVKTANLLSYKPNSSSLRNVNRNRKIVLLRSKEPNIKYSRRKPVLISFPNTHFAVLSFPFYFSFTFVCSAIFVSPSPLCTGPHTETETRKKKRLICCLKNRNQNSSPLTNVNRN